jgi:hypothetical protein
MNEITWHESAIWFFIAQKLLFANQYARKFHKINIEPFKYNIQLLHLNEINMRFYGAEYNYIELGEPHIDQVQV